MNKADVFEIVAAGENSTLEFSRDDLSAVRLAKTAVSFANFRGGCILLGVDDDGTVSGIQREDLERWVMDTCRVPDDWGCRVVADDLRGLRRILRREREAGRLACLGRGPNARWCRIG